MLPALEEWGWGVQWLLLPLEEWGWRVPWLLPPSSLPAENCLQPMLSSHPTAVIR